MRPGSRTLGVAFSDGPTYSYLAAAVVRTNGYLDGLAFDRCTVGGTDATDAIVETFAALGRADVRRILCAGVAPAWFNLIDLHRLHDRVDRPVIAVSYEDSPGLEPTLRREFGGNALTIRLETYRSLPSRHRVVTADGNDPLFVRAVGVEADRANEIVRQLVQDDGSRPEPLRLAAIAASAHRRSIEAE